jgi:Flp pilus assembly protein TadG
MSCKPASRRGLRALFRRREGATALEFALIAGPLFWLLMGMAEFAVISMTQTALDSSVQRAGRLVRTGQAQTQGLSEAAFKDRLCDGVNGVLRIDCDALFVDVQRYDRFTAVDRDVPLQANSLDTSGFGFVPGVGEDVVLVRAYYEWTVFTPMFGPLLSDDGDQTRLLVSSMLFRNEPF